MKQIFMKLTLCMTFIITAMGANAQVKELEKYANRENIEYVYVSKVMLQMVGDKIGSMAHGMNMTAILDNLESIQIINTEHLDASQMLKKEIESILNSDDYELLMQVDEKKNKICFHFNENKKQSVLLMTVTEKNETTIIAFSGKFKKKDLEKMMNAS